VTRVRPGTGLDEDGVVAVWQAAQADRGRRSGGRRAQRVRAALRDPLALLLVAEDDDGAVAGALVAGLARDDGAVLLDVRLLCAAPRSPSPGVTDALLRALGDRYPQVRVRLPADDGVREGPGGPAVGNAPA
jgi:ribosomal protein S18 acetylase RimI-like enzyme